MVKLGVRIFSDGRHPKNGESLAVQRRLARQMRRRRDRLLKRKRRMLSQLIEFGFLPQAETERQQLKTLDPYALRAKGIDHPLTPAEFGRALLHLNQRRGFKSNRKTDKADNDSGALKSAISALRATLADGGHQTLGQWLHHRHQNGEHVRARLSGTTVKDRAYNFYADRSMIEQEFDTLWAAQSQHRPELYTPAAHEALKDTLLFQRKLVPVLPGRCTLEPDERRAPLALPSQQRFRLLQEVNNLRIVYPDQSETALTLAQRDAVIATLEQRKDCPFTTLRNRVLKLPQDTRFNLEAAGRDRLKGNLTSVALGHKNVLGDAWQAIPQSEQDAIVDQLLTVESEQELTQWLVGTLDCDHDTALALANRSLPDGYGNLSRKALDKVLPHLQSDVQTYDKAVLAAGYDSHSHFASEVLTELPYYGIPLKRYVAFEKDNPRNDEERYGKIANPTVHIGLNQIRVVVNALIKRYGRPAEVHIEVARDLKLSRERKTEIARINRTRQLENDKHLEQACAVLQRTPEHLDRNARREIVQKMRLWTELNPNDILDRRCPFSGEQISISKLLSEEVEIEHILPFSQTLDDSMQNKTVALRRANRLKGNRSPFEAFGDDAHADDGFRYADILLRVAKMENRGKGKRFAATAMADWRDENDFVARALTDTAYLARVAKQYLACVCCDKRITTIPGRLTALLRGHYGLNKLLVGSAHKNRDDHRHHAIDAAVIGITDRALLNRVSRASAQARDQQLNKLIDDMPLPWPTFRAQVERAVNALHVSHKPDHGFQGQMHEDTAWGFTASGKATRRERDDTGKRSRTEKNQKLIPISEPGSNRHGTTESGDPKPYKGYVGGSNYCIEIFKNEKGKWDGDVISTFQAYQLAQEMGTEAAQKRLRDPTQTLGNQPLDMRLAIGDCVSIETASGRGIYRVVKMTANKQIFFAPVHEANVDARNRDKTDTFAYVSKMPGSLMKSGARRVTINPIGIKREYR